MSRHIQIYLFTWLGYFALLALLPVRYGTLQSSVAALSLLLWVALSIIAAYLTHHAFARQEIRRGASALDLGRPLEAADLRRLIFLSITIAMFGFVALAYDRVVIQGIDFSQGIAVARQLWRRSGEERDGVSSIFSVLGYLFGFSFFVAATLAHLHWELLSRRMRRHVIVWVTFLVLANSLLTGGRSVILIQLACIAATGAIRAMRGRTMMPGRGARIWVGIGVGLLVAVSYSVYVFSWRAAADDTLPERYAHGMLHYLGGEPTVAFTRLAHLPYSLAATAQFGTVAGAYLTHSYGTFESVLDMQERPGRVTFGFARYLSAKLGLSPPESVEWALGGRFLSLPGSLWYDFGWAGFYGGAVVLGCFLGALAYLIALRRGGGLALCAALVVLVTALLAPLLLAIDLLSVPFLILGFILVDGVHRLWHGPTNWTLVSRPVRETYMEEVP